MKVALAILSYNRLDLWERTLASLYQGGYPFGLVLYDNGSSDGTERRVAELGGICNCTKNHTIGHGVRSAVGLALRHKPDIIVLSADDYEYHQGWLERLVRFWEAAPQPVAICTLSIEPAYEWTPVLAVHSIGEQVVLQRRTVPGANWSFRAALWPQLEPMIPDNAHKYDHRLCAELNAQGCWLCALPLAEHIGENRRSWKS
ncbi:MAG TPA: glycosyltransferase family A protein [Anaerolineae bacterium]|nr:glycosyltransferase family A protein [Anaerolineae bacterium]